MSQYVIEYIDLNGDQRAFSVERPIISGDSANIFMNYLDDTRYLFDPINGYVDTSGNPTPKLFDTLKSIEEINGSTWEFAIADITVMDKKPLRGGRSRAIPTYYNISGDVSGLITGVGDFDDCRIIGIDQERDPDLMSRDLFITNLSGFVTGGTSGIVTEIDYSEILNPVNSSNVNNFYPIAFHGYFYSGETEYFLYGTKKTEIFHESGYIHQDSDGTRYFELSGHPNVLSPIMANYQSGEIFDLLGDININNFRVFHENTYRQYFSGEVELIQHDLSTNNPFVYLTTTNSTIIPHIDIINLNRIRVDFFGVKEGYLNIIRPNKYFRQFLIDNPVNEVIEHGLYTNNVFALISDEEGDLGFPDITVLDINSVSVTAFTKGLLTIFNLDLLSAGEPANGFTSGILTTQLQITPTHDAYVDPWVIGKDLSGQIGLPGTVEVLDNGQIFVDFVIPFSGEIRVISFAEFNQAGALYNLNTCISTDMFPLTDNMFRGNHGLGNPIHQTYPLPSNQEMVLSCFDFEHISGEVWVESGNTWKPTRTIYETTTNRIVVPSTQSGHVVVHYEDENKDTYRFRDADVSPVTWYNQDRVVAIQIAPLPPDDIFLYPDSQLIKISSGSTLPMSGQLAPLTIEFNPGFEVSGDASTRMNLTAFVVDEAGVAVSGELVKFSTIRPLYYDPSGTSNVTKTIQVIDNTPDLFNIPSGILAEISGYVVQTISIFDEITIDPTPSGSLPIYDLNGFLFQTVSGVASYRVPFIAGLHSGDASTPVHELYLETNTFGTAVTPIMFHNNPLMPHARQVCIQCSVSGDPTIKDLDILYVFPYVSGQPHGYTYDDAQLVNTVTTQTTTPHFTVLTGIVPCVSNVGIIDPISFNMLSGIVNIDTSIMSGIINVFQTTSGYVVYHESNPSGEVAYHQIPFEHIVGNIGDIYGPN